MPPVIKGVDDTILTVDTAGVIRAADRPSDSVRVLGEVSFVLTTLIKSDSIQLKGEISFGTAISKQTKSDSIQLKGVVSFSNPSQSPSDSIQLKGVASFVLTSAPAPSTDPWQTEDAPTGAWATEASP